MCDRIGVTFIGPPAAAMRKLGDKVQAKYLAEATGVPVAPWSGGPVEDMASALEHAKDIGYPMILKARSGGGGRGIRMVFDPSELEEAIERTQSEALKAFNDQVIFMEKLVVGRPAHRGPGHRRQLRQRLGARRSGTAPSSAATRS